MNVTISTSRSHRRFIRNIIKSSEPIVFICEYCGLKAKYEMVCMDCDPNDAYAFSVSIIPALFDSEVRVYLCQGCFEEVFATI